MGSPMINTGQMTDEVAVRSGGNGWLLVVSLLHIFEQQLHRPAIVYGMVYSPHERPAGFCSLTGECIACKRTTRRESDGLVLFQVVCQGALAGRASPFQVIVDHHLNGPCRQ